MSGHKRLMVSLGTQDSRRMQELLSRMQSVERDSERIQTKINDIRTEQLSDSYNKLQSRQESFSSSLVGLNHTLQSVEEQTARTILDQTARLHEEISQMGETLWEDTSNLLQQQAYYVQEVLDENITAHQQAFDQLNSAIAMLHNDRDRKQTYALEIVENAVRLMNSVSQTYPHEQYLPGVISREQEVLNMAQHNVWEGFYEAGIASAQQAYLHISAARLELENMILQRDLAYNDTLAKAVEISEWIESIHQIGAVDLDGESLDLEIDVDYWSWGAWREVRRECGHVLRRLQRDSDVLELADLNQVLAVLSNLESRIPNVIFQARENIIASQVRFNIAECIVQGLQEQGFSLSSSCYEHEDQRQPYQTVLTNLEGSEVLVAISPQTSDPLSHFIDLYSQDHEIRTEHELRQRAKELGKSLRVYGLDVNIQTISEDDTTRSIGVEYPDRQYIGRKQRNLEHQILDRD